MSFGTIQAEKMTTESGYTLGAGNASSFKNRIINGNMTIAQRGTAAVTFDAADTYILDRWTQNNGGSATITGQQSTVAPAGFINSLLVTTTSGGAPSSGQLRVLRQRIEGLNVLDLGWGTASAKTVTVSFWVRSNVTGTFACYVANASYNRSQVQTFSISVANTWEYKNVVFVGDTSGTWGTSTGIGIEFGFDVGSGSNFDATVGVWNAAFDSRTSGAVTLSTTTSNNIYVTGVQFEVGTVATSFDYRPYGTELALCQRYYERLTGIASGPYKTGYAYNTAIYLNWTFQVNKRTTGGTCSSSSSGSTLLSAYGTNSSSGAIGALMTGSLAFNTPDLYSVTFYQNLSAATYSPYGTAILWTFNSGQWVDYSVEL